MNYRRRRLYSRRSTLAKGTRGAVQIEFVLSFLTIMFVIFGIWELIMVVYTMNVLSDAAKEGVRYAIVHGGGNINCSGPNPSDTCTNPDPAADNVVNIVKDWARYSFHDVTALNVTVTYPDGLSAAPARVRVQVVYNFIPFTALPFRPAINAVAEGRIVN